MKKNILSEKLKKVETVLVKELFAPAKTLGGENAEQARLAMDAALDNAGVYSSLGAYVHKLGVDGADGLSFPGYAALAQLEQNPLISRIADVLSREATRRWVEFRGADKELAAVVSALHEKWGIRSLFRDAAKTCCYMGGCLFFIDNGAAEEDLETPLYIDGKSITPGSLRGLKRVEPMSVYPLEYNAHNPLSPQYFQNEYWGINGKKVHHTRFIKFSTSLPSVLLRPAYNFFGVPPAQKLLYYVKSFERARNASIDVLENFRLLGLKTNMAEAVSASGAEQAAADICSRLDLFMSAKDNRTAIMIDKDSEDFFELNTNLSGVEGITSQQLELLSLQPGIAVTSLFGTPPKGFNATGDNDIKNTERTINGFREEIGFYSNLEIISKLLMLNEGCPQGEVRAVWLPLAEPDEEKRAQINRIKSQTDAEYLAAGVFDSGEVRNRVLADGFSGYNGEAHK